MTSWHRAQVEGPFTGRGAGSEWEKGGGEREDRPLGTEERREKKREGWEVDRALKREHSEYAGRWCSYWPRLRTHSPRSGQYRCLNTNKDPLFCGFRVLEGIGEPANAQRACKCMPISTTCEWFQEPKPWHHGPKKMSVFLDVLLLWQIHEINFFFVNFISSLKISYTHFDHLHPSLPFHLEPPPYSTHPTLHPLKGISSTICDVHMLLGDVRFPSVCVLLLLVDK